MTELKTLKDLGQGLDSTEILENIKKEAIKWIKAEDKRWNKGLNFPKDYVPSPMRKIFADFFNLSEEDLK